MPRYLTGSNSSRVTKPRILRTESLPFPSAKQASLHRSHSVATALSDESSYKEHKAITVIENGSKDVLSAIKNVRSRMFDEIPERAGMNSVRIAEVLNYQKYLPSAVSLAHIHALRSASSKTEKDIQMLLQDNVLRRLKLVGRGNEVSGLSEVLVLTEAYKPALTRARLPEETITAFLSALEANPRVFALPSSALSKSHADVLIQSGFIVAPSIQSVRSSGSSSSILSQAVISRAASGSQAAVGGEAAFEVMGGVNGIRRQKSEVKEYVLSIPGIATYLQLLDLARNHFLDLLRQFSKHRQAPLYLLRERWNGNVDNDGQVSAAKRIRGEFSNVLPVKTVKWKSLNGLAFDWVVEECMGAGLIELFETHSVGLGVRAL